MRRLPYADRRAELVDAAIRVIAREGLAGASTRAIVAEADMPLGAFHYVFGTRDELITAVIEQITEQERLAAWIDAGTPGPAPRLDEILERGLDAYLRLLESDPSRELVLLDVATHAMRHDPAVVEAQWATYRDAAESSLRYAAELAGTSWSQPLDEIAWSFASALDGLTLTWLTDRDGASARRHIRFLARSFAALSTPVPTPEAPDAH
ncbi:TetR family transcriptional regulator [Microbacterium sp. cx-55]|uniref:TetR/AcrR family transcriptional regulator n=1 Tax=unclassified Microbacterium TaxID=2609290 RepID=UPI001CC1756F|nr:MULTISPECIES: TetR family transcriptional regulator [unclassified Microbacterium]MBZ4487550.1 TetR family transcriptional regulator [Microbacterium sp. cx-55]MCC4908301.1 TetR family transcriptional regulator [Microbacterium sp. cx-59]UGB35570.1 TetR family transcriptional regulator [Microbacterium sp. cx-55]